MDTKKLKTLFKQYPEIKLVYLFGSRANGKVGPLSDYDFAFYLGEKDSGKRFDLRLELITKLSSLLKTEHVDVVILNDAQSPEFKYNIIQEGKLLHQREPFKVIVEPQILEEYFDFYCSLKKYGLTKA